MPDRRDPLLDDLAGAWRGWDPMPVDLPDRILTAIAMAHLDDDHELLTLTTRSDRLLGSRSSADDRTLIEFSADGVQVLLRVVETAGSESRIDGWVEPDGLVRATLTQASLTRVGRVTSASRFDFESVPHALSRLELELTDGRTTRRLRTPHFDT